MQIYDLFYTSAMLLLRLFIGYWKKVMEFHWLKNWQVWVTPLPCIKLRSHLLSKVRARLQSGLLTAYSSRNCVPVAVQVKGSVKIISWTLTFWMPSSCLNCALKSKVGVIRMLFLFQLGLKKFQKYYTKRFFCNRKKDKKNTLRQRTLL